MPVVKADAPAQTTTNGWVDLNDSLMQVAFGGLFSYILQCTDQDSKYKILASNDKTNWFEETPEQDIAKDATKEEAGPAYYLYYKVQIKEGATPGGKVAAQGVAK